MSIGLNTQTKMGNSSSSWSTSYKSIKNFHDAAYRAIDEAISLEEQERQHDAIDKYKDGILFIDKALDVRVVCPEHRDASWDLAVTMIQKMKQTRAEALSRINTITSAPSFVPRQDIVESTAVQTSAADNTDDVPKTYGDLAAALSQLTPGERGSGVRAQIIYSCDNVKLYFISPDETVVQTCEPQTLNIAESIEEEGISKTIFLQIGNWIYPLVPGVSPCYRTDYGAFILPDVHSEVPGSSIGIILPPDADQCVYEILEGILFGIVSQKRPARTRRALPETWSETISNGIRSGGYYMSEGLIVSAHKIGSFLNYGTPKVINILTPSRRDAEINPSVMKGFEIASSASKSASQFTGYIADNVAYATQALGRYLAPHIQAQGTRLLTSGFNLSEQEASSKMNDILTIAAGAVEGFSTVYQGLQTSACILGNSLSNNTVKIVQHKYGVPAGELANNTFSTLGNVITISHNSRFLTPKGLVKKAAKEAGKAVVGDVVMHRDGIYPDLNEVASSSNTSEIKKD